MMREEVVEKVIPVFQKYPVSCAFFFGSYARDDYNSDSDIDIVVEFHIKSPGLLFLVC